MRPPRPATAALCVVALLTAAFGVTGCATRAHTVTVIASWDPDQAEGAAFTRTLAQFTRDTGIKVRYQDSRTINAIVRVEELGDSPPDIAILSSAAELARYAASGKLAAPDRKPAVDPSQWLYRADEPDRPYGVVLKTDLKSMIWYAPDLVADPPRTWTDLVARGASLRGRTAVTPWCLGLRSGAESGWPGTDWIEDILLRQSGVGTYRAWARGDLPWTSPKVLAAWTAWSGLLDAAGMVDRAGVKSMLLTTWDGAGAALSKAGPDGSRCALEHQGSFARAVGAGHTRYVLSPPFPDGPARADLGVEVGVDVAGLFSDSPEARRLLTYLASREGQQTWIDNARGAFFSPRADLDRQRSYGTDPVALSIATELARPNAIRCLDASDFMPQAVAGAFASAVLDYISQPDPARLPEILAQVDAVRQSVRRAEWLADPCRVARTS
jgi:alpha-glucoside transport system substrate-binding protein